MTYSDRIPPQSLQDKKSCCKGQAVHALPPAEVAQIATGRSKESWDTGNDAQAPKSLVGNFKVLPSNYFLRLAK